MKRQDKSDKRDCCRDIFIKQKREVKSSTNLLGSECVFLASTILDNLFDNHRKVFDKIEMQLLQDEQLALVLVDVHERPQARQLERQAHGRVVDERAVLERHVPTRRRLGALESAVLEDGQLFEHVDELAFLVARLDRVRRELDLGQKALQQLDVGVVEQRVEVLRDLDAARVFVLVAEGAQEIESRRGGAQIRHVACECRMSEYARRDRVDALEAEFVEDFHER